MPIPNILLLIQALVFGLLFGSFLNVCIYRIPQKLSIMGRSFCPQCKVAVPFYRNIPVLSYVMQKGKSACCKQPISSQYPLVELLTGLVSVITFLHSQSLAEYFVWFILFMCPLLVISLIDLKLKIIPDVISLPFIVVGVGVRVFQDYPDILLALKTSGFGILIGGGSLLLLAEVVSRIKKREAMGGGDIKLAALLGAFLGWRPLVFVFLASSVLGLIYAVALMIFRKASRQETIPFGPFLSLGGMIFWLYGRVLTDAYFIQLMHLPVNPLFVR